MDYFAVAVGLAQIGIMYWQLRVMTPHGQGTTQPVESTAQPSTLKRYAPVMAMGLLVIASWVPYVLRLNEPEHVAWMAAYGTTSDSYYVVLSSDKLMRYGKKYYLALACGVTDPTVDQFQDQRIVLSSAFSVIPVNVAMAAKFTPQFLETLKSMTTAQPPQPISVWHTAFLIPKGADVARIKRLSDVKDWGGKIIPQNCEPIE